MNIIEKVGLLLLLVTTGSIAKLPIDIVKWEELVLIILFSLVLIIGVWFFLCGDSIEKYLEKTGG